MPFSLLRARPPRALQSRSIPSEPLMADQSYQRRVTRNVAGTLATQLLSWAIAFTVNLFLPRYLGADGMGKIVFAGSFVALFGTLASLGVSTFLIKEIARDRTKTAPLLAAALTLRLPLTTLFAGVAIGLIHLMGHSATTQTLATIFGAALIIGAATDVFTSVLVGQENIGRQNLATLLDKFLGSGLTLALIAAHAPITWIAAVGIATGGAALAFSARPFLTTRGAFVGERRTAPVTNERRRGIGAGTRARVDSASPLAQETRLDLMRYLVIGGAPFFTSLLFRSIYGQADITIIALLLGPEIGDPVIGWYSVAGRLLGSILFIPTALAAALLPTLIRLEAENKERFDSLVTRALTLVTVAAVPIAAPVILMPGRILFGLLHYSPEYAPSAIPLAIYGAGCLLWFMTQIAGTALIARGQERAMNRVFFVAMVLTLGGCFAAIPLTQHHLGNAAIGAASVDVAVEIYITIAFLRLLRPKWDGLSIFVRSCLACVPLLFFLAVFHAAVWQILVSIAAGVLLYGGLLFAFRVVGRSDVEMFSHLKSAK